MNAGIASNTRPTLLSKSGRSLPRARVASHRCLRVESSPLRSSPLFFLILSIHTVFVANRNDFHWDRIRPLCVHLLARWPYLPSTYVRSRLYGGF